MFRGRPPRVFHRRLVLGILGVGPVAWGSDTVLFQWIFRRFCGHFCVGRHWWWLLGVCFPVGVLPYWCAGVGCWRFCVGCVLTDSGFFLALSGPLGGLWAMHGIGALVCMPHIPRFFLLVSFTDTLLVVSILDIV